MKASEHPILSRVETIQKKLVDGIDPDVAPQDPQEFLDWWWETYNKDCQDCFLCESRTVVVKPDGIASASIMVIGEGPGFLEDLSGIPLVGPAELRGSRCGKCKTHLKCYGSRYLKKQDDWGRKSGVITCNPDFTKTQMIRHNFFLRSAGSVIDGILHAEWKFAYPRHNWVVQHNEANPNDQWKHVSPWYFTNAIMCRSTDSTGVKDQEPPSVALTACKRHLAMQWAAVQPKIIICLGRSAMGLLLGNKDKSKSIIPNTITETKFGPVVYQAHPAHFMREKNKAVKGLGYAKVLSTFEKALEYTPPVHVLDEPATSEDVVKVLDGSN